MIYIKKYYEEDTDTEYIKPSDVFNYYEEWSDKGQYYYSFLLRVADYLHYFNFNTSTAFGNPDYSKMNGIVLGWCFGAEWEIKEDCNKIEIFSKKGRKIMVIEKPKTPNTELSKRKEIDKTWREVLG